MLKNISDVMNNINTNELDLFLSKTDANFICQSDIKETKIDYSWLNVLESTLPNIDKIVRNPRRFIVQEEDVVIVEKTKRVSLETIKHLAQHSENIQDIDKNGDVVPKKLLNVHKEDTTDLYENRFIYTLVTRLETFINRQLENLDLVSNKEIKKDVKYVAETNIKNKKVSVEVKLHEENKIDLSEFGSDYKNRILACYEVISGFRTTEMIKELVGCSLVRNPIRKTNLILREPNFQKAFILWQYLDNFEYKDPKVVNYEKLTDTSKETKDEFTLAYFIDCNALDERRENLMQYKDIDAKLNKLLNDYIYEDNYNLENFLNKSREYFNIVLNEKQKRIENITKIYEKFINNHTNNIKELEEMF